MMMNLINIIVKKLIIEIETVLNLRGFGDCLDEEDGDFEEKRCRGWLPTQIYPKLWHCQTKGGDLVLGPKPKLLKVSMNKMLGFFMEENSTV